MSLRKSRSLAPAFSLKTLRLIAYEETLALLQKLCYTMLTMKKTFSLIDKIAFVAFCALQLYIWISLLTKSGNSMRYVSYAGVLLCFLYSFAFFYNGKQQKAQCTALFFTCIADFFLILLQGKWKTVAMLAFLCAQICYAYRVFLLASNKKEKHLQIFLRVLLTVAVLLVLFAVLKGKTRALHAISLVYYAQMLISLGFAFRHFKRNAQTKLLTIGLLLFCLCDLSIGFDFLIDIFSLSSGNFIYKVMHLPVSFVNIFYPPSQALLCISARTFKK